eukprot:s1091_g20.t1
MRVEPEAYEGGSSATSQVAPWPESFESQGEPTMRSRMTTSQQSSMVGTGLVSTLAADQAMPVHRCRAPRREDGTASTEHQGASLETPRRISAEELRQRRPPTPPRPTLGGAINEGASQTCLTSLRDGPPPNFGICPIGAPLPGEWFQKSASLTDRGKHFKVQMKDIVPEEQPDLVRGCPGLVTWDLMRPHQWTSNQRESLEEVVERSGLAQFWPLHLRDLWKLLEEEPKSPKRDRWEELPINAAHVLMVRLHALAIAKLTSGSYELVAGHRFGKGNPFLDDQWTGMTCYIKAKRA